MDILWHCDMPFWCVFICTQCHRGFRYCMHCHWNWPLNWPDKDSVLLNRPLCNDCALQQRDDS